jgi:NADPH:quinone reductase-like Zn-dependent oxidoreductase
MKLLTKTKMRAVVINKFGGIETLLLQKRPIPEVGTNEILIHVESAGVGEWDPFEREGGFASIFGIEPKFPYVLGSDGTGIVEAIGKNVKRFKEGDRVYAVSLVNPKGGFYAEYTAVKEDDAAIIPDNLTTEQAGALGVDAITALRGLDDNLGLKRGESLLIFGASGGIGHLALQLAKRMGVRVLAIASGDDGVALCHKLGADLAVDGHKVDIEAVAREFAPNGIDAALITAGGEIAEKALIAMREGGRIAYPNGVEPEPKTRPGITISSYDGNADPEIFKKLNSLIELGPFYVHIAKIFSLEHAAEAQRALETHHLGKIALRP